MSTADTAIATTRQWLQQHIVGLQLCPFAIPIVQRGNYRIVCCTESDRDRLMAAVSLEMEALQGCTEDEAATSLLVFTAALADFYDYLDFLDEAQTLLTATGLEGVLQIATFHPDYHFAGEPADSPSHYTNRSPYPTLHFIREAQLSRFVLDDNDSERIVAQNIATMERIGVAQLQQRLLTIKE